MKKILMSLLTIAIVGALITGGTIAYFSDTVKNTIETNNATVQIGERTGFPLKFENLTPCVWTDWQVVTLQSDSSIAMDVYIGLQDKGLGGADLKDWLDVQIDRSPAGGTWVGVYDGKAVGLFAAWLKVADDMAKGQKDWYRVRVHLADNTPNALQGAWTAAWVLIHGVQWNGPAPVVAPYVYPVP